MFFILEKGANMISKIAEFENEYKVEQYKKMKASKKAQRAKMQKVNQSGETSTSNETKEDMQSLISKYMIDYYSSLPLRLRLNPKDKE